MTDWYADYYRQSRGYNDNDLRELRGRGEHSRVRL
jgi:hypothetical protein